MLRQLSSPVRVNFGMGPSFFGISPCPRNYGHAQGTTVEAGTGYKKAFLYPVPFMGILYLVPFLKPTCR